MTGRNIILPANLGSATTITDVPAGPRPCRRRHPLAVTSRVQGCSEHAFSKWRKDPVPQRDSDDAHLINATLDVHADDPEFRFRFRFLTLSDLAATTPVPGSARARAHTRGAPPGRPGHGPTQAVSTGPEPGLWSGPPLASASTSIKFRMSRLTSLKCECHSVAKQIASVLIVGRLRSPQLSAALASALADYRDGVARLEGLEWKLALRWA